MTAITARVAEVQTAHDNAGVWYPVAVLRDVKRSLRLKAGEKDVAVGDVVFLDEPEDRWFPPTVTVLRESRMQPAAPCQSVCPACGTATVAADDAPYGGCRLCPNERWCPAQIVSRLGWMGKPQALRLTALANNWLLRVLHESGTLTDERGLFDLSPAILDRAVNYVPPRSGAYSARFDTFDSQRLMRDLRDARNLPAARILTALAPSATRWGDPDNYGPLQWDLLRGFHSIHALSDATWEEISDGLEKQMSKRHRGPRLAPTHRDEIAQRVASWFGAPQNLELIRRWDDAGVRMEEPYARQTLIDVTVGFVRSGDGRSEQLTTAWLRAEDDVYRRGGRVPRWPTSDNSHIYAPNKPSPDILEKARGTRTVLTSSEFRQLLHGGPKEVPPSVPAADKLWGEILQAHPSRVKIGSRGRLPMNPSTVLQGALYMYTRSTGQIAVIVATSLQEAINALETDPDSVFIRTRTIWVPGSREALRESSPVLRQPKSPLQRGRGRLVRRDEDWLTVPHVAGIYRIHLVDEIGPCVYVGRSQDLRVRPRRHEKTAGLPWSDGTTLGVRQIELLAVKGTREFDAWTMTDLDDAEEEHITRAQQRYAQGETAERVLNVTGGRNGPPSRPKTDTFVWKAEQHAGLDEKGSSSGVADRPVG